MRRILPRCAGCAHASAGLKFRPLVQVPASLGARYRLGFSANVVNVLNHFPASHACPEAENAPHRAPLTARRRPPARGVRRS